MKIEPDSVYSFFLKQLTLLTGSLSLAVPNPDSYQDGTAFCFIQTSVHGQ